MRRVLTALAAATVAVTVAMGGVAAPAPAKSAAPAPAKRATASGTGGAVATVDPYASRAALRVLRDGGNAIDAAVAAAGVLGVTEPYSSGIGGGGFMVAYLADDRRVVTIDHREKAPQSIRPDSFLDADGEPFPTAELFTSGLAVGVPGTVLGWEEALRRYGTQGLDTLLRPAIRVARRGFVVDRTFYEQTKANLDPAYLRRFRAFPATRELFLTPEGRPWPVGTVLRNPDLARTYRYIAREGSRAFYTGTVASDIVSTVTNPPVDPLVDINVRPGGMTEGDLADYDVQISEPTVSDYRGFQVYGMGPPSSGGSTVGEALNILEATDLGDVGRARALHRYLEASRLAFADRGAYLGDREYTDVPLEGLLSDEFAATRRRLIGPRAGTSPAPVGDPYPFQDDPSYPLRPDASDDSALPGAATTHLTVSDSYGNVVSYTFTIEQTGGSAMVVPGYGFLLNNELTDFNIVPPHPNAAEPGKRPRSSMSPTIVLRDGRPVVALGSPGGSTIITTVLQVLINHLDFGMSLPQAIAAPRASQRDTTETSAEPAFASSPVAQRLRARGHVFAPPSAGLLPGTEIGAVTGIRFRPGGRVVAAAEPVRRGGGSALVERPGS